MTTERSVIVRFKGDVTDLRTATRAAGVTVREMRDRLESAARSGHDMARGADAAAGQVRDLRTSATTAAPPVRALTTAADAAGGEMRQLARAADEAGDEVDELGNKAVRASVKMRALRAAGGGGQRLLRFANAGADAAGAGAVGAATGAQTVLRSISPALVNPYVVAIGGAIAGALLPVLGALIASAVVGAVGVGGIIGGVALAAGDPRVAKAFSTMGSTVFSDLQNMAQAKFVNPLVASAGRFGAAWTVVSGDVEAIFGSLATEVIPLTEGLTGLAERAMPGIRAAAEAARPILHTLARELPQLGDALGTMFGLMSDAGPGAAAAFSIALKLVSYQLVQIGLFVNGASKAFMGLVNAWVATVRFLAGLPAPVLAALGPVAASLAGTAEATTKWKESLDDTGSSVGDTASDVDELNDALKVSLTRFDELFGRTMNSWEANLGYQQALDDLTESILKNSGTLDANTEKGRANQRALKDGIEWANRMRDAEIAASDGSAFAIDAANRKYREHIEALAAAAIKAGANKDQVWALINALYSIPKTVESNVIVRHTTEYRSYRAGERGDPVKQRWGGVVEHAANGALSTAAVFGAGPTLYAFAEPETGGEAFIPRKGNHNRNMAILQHAAGWMGATVMPKGQAGIDYDRLGSAVARQLAPLLTQIGGAQYIGEWRVGASDLALAVRRGERDLSRTG